MNPELDSLRTNFASGLQNLIEQRTHESEIDQLERELSNPETSFIGAIRDATGDITWYMPNEPESFRLELDDSVTGFESRIINSSRRSAQDSKWSSEIFDEEGHVRDTEDTSQEFYQYAALSTARKLLNKPDVLSQATGLLVAARVAMFNLPDDYHGEKPKRHKQETIDDVLFRKAHLLLRDKLSKETKEQQTFLEFFRSARDSFDIDEGFKRYVSVLIHPDAEELRQGRSDAIIEAFAGKILDLLARDQTTPESIREEQFKLAKLRELRKEQREPEPETVNWEILPPEALEEIERTGETGSKEGTPDFVDPERLKWLARLAIDWGNEAYIVVSSLRDRSDTNRYYAAILPGLSGGIPVEHAVAENASSGNATYVFRAERGLNLDGSTWLTWQDVLKDTKAGARALGAKRVLHGQYWNENVIEYLTRPDADLDSKYYKR
jgi:hypothetical protein